jgi:hypothetical protein
MSRTSRIAALIGDFHHEPGPMRAAREAAAGSDARIDFFNDPLAAPWEHLHDCGVLVVAREGRVAPRESKTLWFTERHERAIAAFVRVDSADTTRLLESSAPDYGSSTTARAHACVAGRVFCFTPGHRAEVLADPAYRRFLTNGIQWVQRRL